jgi:dTDP-4-amino-4,6-dideoxygalactose transaminase
MKVPFIDIKACFHPLHDEIFRELEGVFDRCDFVLGQPVKKIEEAVRGYCGTKHALGVANGTDALIIALRAIGIKEGDEVITTPFTFIATAEAVYESGARPVFCDISPASYNLCPAAVTEFIEKNCDKTADGHVNRATGGRVRAILPVHLYGLMADMNAFLEMKKKYGLAVVEDAAQAFGATIDIDGRSVQAGAAGDAGCISFYPSKNLGGAGDGGMIVTNRDDVHEAAEVLHVHGSKVRYYHDVFGYNSRLDSIQAAVLLVKLTRLNDWLAMRAANAKKYICHLRETLSASGIQAVMSDELPATGVRPENAVVLPAAPKGFFHTFNSFEIRVPDRDNTAKALNESGIGSMIYYPLPLHAQPVFGYLGYHQGDFPVTEEVCKDILALPQYPEIAEEAIEYVALTLADILKNRKQ